MTISMAPSGTLPESVIPADLLEARILPSGGDAESTSRQSVVAVEIGTYTIENGGKLYYFATHTFTTPPDDVPADEVVEGRLIPGVILGQQVPTTDVGTYGGIVGRSIGEIELANEDGRLDELVDGAVDGRRVTVLIGSASNNEAGGGIAYLDAHRAFVAAGDSWEPSLTRMVLSMRDAAERLRSPVSPRRYAGTGGTEGTPDLKDRTRPRTLGQCLNVAPVLLDPTRLVYQLEDGPIRAIDAIYDRGVQLTGAVDDVATYAELAAAPTTPGGYLTCLATGHFRLGSPPAGSVTCDVLGMVTATYHGWSEPWDDGLLFDDLYGWSEPVPGHGYGEALPDLVMSLLTIGGWSLDKIDRGSFIELRDRLPAPMGYHVPAGRDASIEDCISELCRGVGVAAGPDRLGRYRLALIAPPARKTSRIFTERSILSLERLPLPWRVPARSWSIGYGRHWTVQADADLAGAVSSERRQALAEEYRIATVKDDIAKVLHVTSRDSEMIPSCLLREADARSTAARMVELYGQGKAPYRARVKRNFAADIGNTVQLEHPRLGFAAGKRLMVIGANYDLGGLATELTVLG